MIQMKKLLILLLTLILNALPLHANQNPIPFQDLIIDKMYDISPTKNADTIAVGAARYRMKKNKTSLDMSGGYSGPEVGGFIRLALRHNISSSSTVIISYANFMESYLEGVYSVGYYRELYWDKKNKIVLKGNFCYDYVDYKDDLAGQILRANLMVSRAINRFVLFSGVSFPMISSLSKAGYSYSGLVTEAFAYTGVECVINRYISLYSDWVKDQFSVGVSLGRVPFKYIVNSKNDDVFLIGHPFYMY
jgi:hypothetical protein